MSQQASLVIDEQQEEEENPMNMVEDNGIEALVEAQDEDSPTKDDQNEALDKVDDNQAPI